MLVFKPSPPAPDLWHLISDPANLYPALTVLAVAIAAGCVVLAVTVRARIETRATRHGPLYRFPKRVTRQQILLALGKITPLQVSILRFIVDGYLEGVGCAEVAAHFNLRKADAKRHLRLLHRLGLLYVKRCPEGPTLFFLIESVMAKVGEPRFFDLIGLTGLA